MRLDIKVNGKPITDRDIRALYAINHALKVLSTPRMMIHNLAWFADELGLKLVPKAKP